MDDRLKEASGELSRLARIKPHETDLVNVSRYKLPGKILMSLGGLIWRSEELGEQAIQALDQQNFVTSAILTRALMESLGGIILIQNLIEKSISHGLSPDFISKIDKLLLGSKQWSELNDPIHVNNLLRDTQKIIPGFFDEHYASLSEYSHPNWLGTYGSYGIIHKEEAKVSFARGGRSAKRHYEMILGRLAGSIGLCLGYSERVYSMMPDFIKVVEAFYEGQDPFER
ncbi:hypothetical protein ACX40Y_12510 [Sphingomonas sp. RS6]